MKKSVSVILALALCLCLGASAFAAPSGADEARFAELVAANSSEALRSRHRSVLSEQQMFLDGEVSYRYEMYMDGDLFFQYDNDDTGILVTRDAFLQCFDYNRASLFFDKADGSFDDGVLAGTLRLFTLSVANEKLQSLEEKDGTVLARTLIDEEEHVRAELENTGSGNEYRAGMAIEFTYTFDAATSDLLHSEGEIIEADGTLLRYMNDDYRYDVETPDPAAEGALFAAYFADGEKHSVSVTYGADTDKPVTAVHLLPAGYAFGIVRDGRYVEADELFTDPACTHPMSELAPDAPVPTAFYLKG